MSYSPDTQYNLYDLIKKADGGDLDAMETAVSLIAAEGYTEDDPDGEITERRFSYLRQLADSGRTSAYIMLGDAYLQGKGITKDAVEAINWYKKAAENGVMFGNECIGMIYYEGNGVPTDYQKAYEYFTKDNGRKSFCTIYSLGEMYRCGLYVMKDQVKAYDYYSGIVNSEEPYPELDDYYWRACYRVGIALHYGYGVKKDLSTAVEVFAKAKMLYESRGESTVQTGITKEEFYQEWMLLNQDAGKY